MSDMLRVVLFRDGEQQWGAQALERDIAAHGPTRDAALAALRMALLAHVTFDRRQQRVPLSWLAPAPERLWRQGAENGTVSVPI